MLVIYLQLKGKNIKTQSFKKDDYIKFQWRESTVLEPVIVEKEEATHFCLVDEQNYIFLPEQINAPCEEFDPVYNTSETVGGIVWDISLLSKIMEVLK
ncbi:MAG: hypothetical protein ACKPEN_06195 [Planktothrix sp.]|uniref:hypothetical protein n=1 Tax=Planktothrix sp. TaxID=3088171 RepID=UPI0038D3DDF7